MNPISNEFLVSTKIQENYLVPKKNNNAVEHANISGNLSFQEIFSKTVQNKTDDLVFSKHATSRLQERSIELTRDQIERLNLGTKQAKDKGIKDSLVIMDDLAFIINIPNHTVVTAMNQTTNENIFTNIDGAVIV